jgi:SagB-type dehydrogenase family enzyme
MQLVNRLPRRAQNMRTSQECVALRPVLCFYESARISPVRRARPTRCTARRPRKGRVFGIRSRSCAALRQRVRDHRCSFSCAARNRVRCRFTTSLAFAPRADLWDAYDPGVASIRTYHERTQHHLDRYAAALGYLDWATQPDPFRRYVGAKRMELPLAAPDGSPGYADLFRSGADRAVDPAAFDAAAVGRLFQDSLALSAWKEYRGSRWALRVNPSSGNLHPTEAYFLAGGLPGLFDRPLLCHYAPDAHALELRAELPQELWSKITTGLPEGAVLLGLTSIPWRESWKYGERAYRYCMQDLGHAIGAIGFAAAALGWRIALLPLADRALATLLGIGRQQGPEAEHPDALLLVHPDAHPGAKWARSFALDEATVAELRLLPMQGTPAPLSRDHQEWPSIDDAIAATRLDGRPPASFWNQPPSTASTAGVPATPGRDARALFHQRRSAVAMDGRTGTESATFFATLARVCDPDQPPLRALPWRSRIHLVLFVHRVDGLVPGIYCLVRGEQDPRWLRERMRTEFLWERPASVPAALPLFLLVPIDCRQAAREVCCHQEIAANSAFAIAMLAEFAPTLEAIGPWAWRVLHWEAGAIGQLLYLEAEAADLRATGIGCFFDSAVHKLLGIESDDLRTIYHFTVGGAVEDARLQIESPYPERA